MNRYEFEDKISESPFGQIIDTLTGGHSPFTLLQTMLIHAIPSVASISKSKTVPSSAFILSNGANEMIRIERIQSAQVDLSRMPI